ncbi:hypothetical protein WJX75_002515 [Coccomyxa subellipsoidea]|uniref:DUF1868 domain-containing protein n=1 Tax=Coccomyxa subellipsoidea TaxID=248742 RepID=A0ABR2YDM4_9CHLO
MSAVARAFGRLNSPHVEGEPVATRGNELIEILSSTAACVLRPHAFFVSWQGVVTLAYRGFPPALVRLKQHLDRRHGSLPKENPGSKWPKTSLGAVKDKCRLDPQQLDSLLRICREETEILRGDELASHGFLVDRAAVAVFECRSLERLVSWQEVGFSGEVDESLPEAEETERVDRIMAEAEAPDYWFAASRDGNRESHYRDDHLGVTLAFGLPLETGHIEAAAQIGGLIDRFRQRVNAELPGMYAWFADNSLHVTLRAVI